MMSRSAKVRFGVKFEKYIILRIINSIINGNRLTESQVSMHNIETSFVVSMSIYNHEASPIFQETHRLYLSFTHYHHIQFEE